MLKTEFSGRIEIEKGSEIGYARGTGFVRWKCSFWFYVCSSSWGGGGDGCEVSEAIVKKDTNPSAQSDQDRNAFAVGGR